MNATARINQALPSIDDDKCLVRALHRVQAIIEFNLDGTIITANENFLQTLGYSLDEICGKHHRMFCEPDYVSSPAYQAFWTKLNQGLPDSGEYKRNGKNGKIVWINASYTPIFDESGKLYKVVKFASDVTAVKLKSLENEARLQAINRSQAVIEFNLDGTVMGANDNFLKTLGYTIEEIKGRHHSMFCDPALVSSHAYNAFWQKLGRGEYDAGRYKRIHKSGREV